MRTAIIDESLHGPVTNGALLCPELRSDLLLSNRQEHTRNNHVNKSFKGYFARDFAHHFVLA